MVIWQPTFIIDCSPAAYNEVEALSTSRFGICAMSIKITVQVDQELSPLELKGLLIQTACEYETSGIHPGILVVGWTGRSKRVGETRQTDERLCSREEIRIYAVDGPTRCWRAFVRKLITGLRYLQSSVWRRPDEKDFYVRRMSSASNWLGRRVHSLPFVQGKSHLYMRGRVLHHMFLLSCLCRHSSTSFS